MRRSPFLLLTLPATLALGAATLERGEVLLASGAPVMTWTLVDGDLRATFAPSLGGKLISLRAADGTELMSRSERPYRQRVPGAAYGETEFDGMDECFPAVAPGPYPLPPWQEREVADHGELCQQAWEVVDTTGGLTLRASGLRFPYTFTRRSELVDGRLTLRYRVDNHGESPFTCSYANHPLFAADAGAGLELPAETPVRHALSRGGFLGKRGLETTWGELTRTDGRRFAEHQFEPGSGEYYKLYFGPFETGAATYRLGSGHRVHLEWDDSVLPYLAVWVSAGAVGGLHHYGAEPAMSRHDDLAAAHAAGEAATIEAGGSLEWTIAMRVESPDALPTPAEPAMLDSEDER